MRKDIIYISVFLVLIGITIAFRFPTVGNAILDKDFCEDGSEYGACSVDLPYLCQDGSLVENCDVCGCPGGLECSNGQCINTFMCETGEGSCSNECEIYDIEYQPLTFSCNINENTFGNINVEGSKKVYVNVEVQNNNNFKVNNLDVKASIDFDGSKAEDGFTLKSVETGIDYKETLTLNIPDNIDVSKDYSLIISYNYDGGNLEQEYSVSLTGTSGSVTIRNVNIEQGKLIRLGDLYVGSEIINKKCCVKKAKEEISNDRFFGYCGDVENGKCDNSKPLFCKDGSLIDNCNECGCLEGYKCNIDGKCSVNEHETRADSFIIGSGLQVEDSVITNFVVDKFSQITVIEEKPILVIGKQEVNLSIRNNILNAKVDKDKKPFINISLGE